MNQNQRPVEKEYRSSQMYKTLTGAGIPAADKLAEGLGKAAAGLDNALNTVAPAVKSAAQSVRQAQSQAQQAQQAQRPGENDGSYHYTYRYQGKAAPSGGATTQTKPPQANPPQNHHPQPGQQQPLRPGQPGWGWNNNVHPPKGVTPAPPPKMPQAGRGFQPGGNVPMKVVRRGSPARYYITGVAAIIYAMNFQMMEIPQWAVFALVMALIFFLSGTLFRGKKEFVPIETPKPVPEPKPEPEAKKEPEPEKKSPG